MMPPHYFPAMPEAPQDGRRQSPTDSRRSSLTDARGPLTTEARRTTSVEDARRASSADPRRTALPPAPRRTSLTDALYTYSALGTGQAVHPAWSAGADLPSPLEGPYRRGSLASIASSLGPPTPSSSQSSFFPSDPVVRRQSSPGLGHFASSFSLAPGPTVDLQPLPAPPKPPSPPVAPVAPPVLPLPPAQAQPQQTPPAGSFCSLVGTLATTAIKLRDLDRVEGAFWVFSDMSVRIEGMFRIRIQVVDLTDGPECPVLATVFTDPFEVFSARRLCVSI